MESILAKKVTGEATSSELAILDKWRNESAKNQSSYDEYSILWEMSAKYEPQSFEPDFESALSSHLGLLQQEKKELPVVKEESVVITMKQESKTLFFFIKRLSSFAAILILGIASVFLFGNRSTTITADIGIRFVSLDDGSKIWLDEGASIVYKNGFGSVHRNIELRGRAYFDVYRNESLPFNIQENDINVTVLGTSFTVDGNNNIVSVNSGEVSVTSDDELVILTKNQKTQLSNNKLSTTIEKTNTAIWRNKTLSFDNSPFFQVVADINMFHNDKLEVDNNSLQTDCTFTSGGMSSESLENIIKILKKSYDLEVSTSDNGKINLSIVDCE